MKFDYTTFNPPFMESMDDTSDNPVYHLFIDEARRIADVSIVITPAKFLFNAGKTPKKWNEKILKDPHFKVIRYEPDHRKIFPNNEIKGGVAITCYNNKKKFTPVEVFTKYDELNHILSKVKTDDDNSIAAMVYAPESFKFTSQFHEDYPQAEGMLSKGHKNDLTTNIFEKLGKNVFSDEKLGDGYAAVYGAIKLKRKTKWIKSEYLRKTVNFDKYKVLLPKANGSGVFGDTLSSPFIASPNEGHTQTYLSIGSFDTQQEAENLLKYLHTKFSRAMLGVLKVTQDNKKKVWRKVPLQDFTENSDIDWSKSISEIDQQLYRKYGLSDNEISFIEEKVQTME